MCIIDRPSASDPNYLEKIDLPIKIPTNPIFIQPIIVRVFDTRLGGYSKPMVATGTIDMEEKMPNSPKYKAPQSDAFYRPADDRGGVASGTETAEEKIAKEKEILSKQQFDPASVLEQRDKQKADDSFVSTQEPISAEAFLKLRQNRLYHCYPYHMES